MSGAAPRPSAPATSADLLDALTYRRLVAHLRARPDVQNLDLMLAAGFCRNCLSKWRHAAAWELGLEARSYEDALADVYGPGGYAAWKRDHQRAGSKEQLDAFEAVKRSKLHADYAGFEEAPVPRAALPPPPSKVAKLEDGAGGASVAGAPAPSEECCEIPAGPVPAHSSSRAPPLPSSSPLRVRVLTLSDRASRGEYADASGPAVRAALAAAGFTVLEVRVLPDERAAIAAQLRAWTADPGTDVVVTTGGTGLGARDVTPEATLDVVQRRVPGIPELLRRATAALEPRAALSRAEAGAANGTLIVNLPGSPRAVAECCGALVPLLARAVEVLRREEREERADAP